MSNVLQKITARAKQIKKAHPGKKWTDCIKQASREVKAGTKAPVKKKAAKKAVKKAARPKPSSTRQTGTSNTAYDKRVKAKQPGKRVSATGRVYYERRKNRSDRPGALSGTRSDIKSLQSLVKLSKSNYDRLQKEVKEATAKHKAAKGTFEKMMSKQRLDRLKYELRERKTVLAGLAREMKKLK